MDEFYQQIMITFCFFDEWSILSHNRSTIHGRNLEILLNDIAPYTDETFCTDETLWRVLKALKCSWMSDWLWTTFLATIYCSFYDVLPSSRPLVVDSKAHRSGAMSTTQIGENCESRQVGIECGSGRDWWSRCGRDAAGIARAGGRGHSPELTRDACASQPDSPHRARQPQGNCERSQERHQQPAG